MALIGIPIGIVLLGLGLKGILRMLGMGGEEVGLYCGTCPHEIGQHRQGPPATAWPCKKCPCSRYTSGLFLANERRYNSR